MVLYVLNCIKIREKSWNIDFYISQYCIEREIKEYKLYSQPILKAKAVSHFVYELHK